MDKGSFTRPTKVVDLSGMGTVEFVTVGDMTVSKLTFHRGWRWSLHVKPLVGGDSCQTFHHGFVVDGRLAVRMDDGTEAEFRAGDVWIIPPGHDAWVLGDETVVALEFTPAATVG